MSTHTGNDRIRTVVEKAWSDPAFKAKLLKDPHAALKSLGMEVPAGITVRVHEDKPEERHYVLPMPLPTDLSDAQLESIAGGTTSTVTKGKKKSNPVSTPSIGVINQGGG